MATDNLIERILGNPDQYPDEFKAWLPRFLENNVLLRVADFQLPQVDGQHDVSAELGFQHGWANLGGADEVASFYRDPFGRAYLSGTVAGGGAGQVICTLSGGYRPRATHRFAVITDTGIGRVDVLATGDVQHVSGGTGYVQLSGIGFRVF